MPEIAPKAAQLTVFQRSPTWVGPRYDEPFTAEQHDLFERDPQEAQKVRDAAFMAYESGDFAVDSRHDEGVDGVRQQVRHRQREGSRPAGQAHPVTPRRLQTTVVLRDWFPTFDLPHVRLETAPIVEFTERGLRTADGVEHEADTVIYGTGFRAADYLGSLDVYGRGGRRLHDDWSDGAEAYLGTAVPGYPNLFTLYGPNTNGVQSIIYILEVQTEFVRRLLDAMVGWRGAGGRGQTECPPGLQRRDPGRTRRNGMARRMQQLLSSPERQGRHSVSLPRNGIGHSARRSGPRSLRLSPVQRPSATGSRIVRGIHHSAIVTSDVGRSKRFWQDGLGLTELFDIEFDGDWPTLFGANTDRLRSVFLADPEYPQTGILELVMFDGAQEAPRAAGCPADGILSAVLGARRRR